MPETVSSAPGIDRLRYPDEHLGWLVTDFGLGRKILRDPRFSQRPLRFAIDDGGFQGALSGPESAGDLLRIDPPQHTRVRRLQARYFTVKCVAEHREKIEEVVNLCLDELEEHGSPADFVEMFAYPVPSMVICDVLGVPREDRGRFERPDAVVTAFTETTPAEKITAMAEFYAFIREVIEEKRARPGDDLLSELVTGGELDEDELAGVTFFLFAGGHHTTLTNFSLGLLFLLSDRDRWDAARADLSTIDRTVEELLRHVSPIRSLPRTATEDVELGGVVIRAGEAVTVWARLPSGDPDAVEHLDRFQPSREPIANHAFGYGRHICLGQHLARLELQVGFETLMRRFPSLRLAEPAVRIPTQRIEVAGCLGETEPVGVRRLPVAWS
jgi:cytochrome P450